MTLALLLFDSLENPALLLFALPAVLYVLVLAITARVKVRAGAGLVIAFLRAVLVFTLIVAVARPLVTDIVPSTVRADLILDLSRSLGEDARTNLINDAEAWVLDARRQDKDLEVRVVAFAGRSQVVLQGRPSEDEVRAAFDGVRTREFIDSLDPLHSDLAGALSALEATARDDVRTTRVIVTDGALLPPASDLSLLPGTLFATPQGLSGAVVSADALAMPGRVEEGEPVPMELTYTSSVERNVSMHLLIDGVLKKELSLPLRLGTHQVNFGGEDLELEAGNHQVLLRLMPDDDEPSDDAAGAVVRVMPRKHVLYLVGDHRGTRAPAVQRALRAQKVDLVAQAAGEAPLSENEWARTRAVVLDRVPPAGVSDELADRIREHVGAGGGLILIPRDDENELLAWNRSSLKDLLPLAGLPAITLPPEKEDPEKKTKEKLAPPEIKDSKEKEVEAPTLALLLVIDASASMKQGGRMVYARRGAIATLRKLHPEDRIGVIAYNERPTEVVPVQEAAAGAAIERAIMRIAPAGATDIKEALEFAKNTLEREDAAIKSIVLLSDGFTAPFNVKRTSQDLLAAGISVTTVGVGSSFDTGTLTQIAKYSGGTGPIPARNARELPAVMVDVAARLIDQHNLREAPSKEKTPKPDDKIHRPETASGQGEKSEATDETNAKRIDLVTGRNTSYLDGIPMNFAPSVYGLHRTQEKDSAWTSILSRDRRPVLSHWRVGDGVVAMTTLALEGENARDLLLWEAYSPLVAQLVRFCSWDATLERYQLHGRVQERRAVLDLDDLLSRRRDVAWQVTAAGMEAETRFLGEGRHLVAAVENWPGPFAHFVVRGPVGGDEQSLSLFVPPPAEVKTRGLDLERLETWANALGGRVMPGDLGDLRVDAEPVNFRKSVPWFWNGAYWIIVVFAVELLMKRFLRRSEGSAVAA